METQKIQELQFRDYMVRATAAEGFVRAFAVTSRGVAEEARRAHDLSPVACAALGRLMSAALMMGWDLKSEQDLITLQIRGDGPIGGLLVTADSEGHVKGYVNHPEVLLPATAAGKLDVGGAVGRGVLSVIRDNGLGEPYTGQTELVSGEIAEDVAYYFAASEQIPSAVALGVLMNKNNTVRQAGGFIVQLMPGAPEELEAQLEQRILAAGTMTQLLSRGLGPEEILNLLLEGMDPEINDTLPVSFQCKCSRDKAEKVLISVGRELLEEMIADGKEEEIVCHFCGKRYLFNTEDLRELLERAR